MAQWPEIIADSADLLAASLADPSEKPQHDRPQSSTSIPSAPPTLPTQSSLFLLNIGKQRSRTPTSSASDVESSSKRRKLEHEPVIDEDQLRFEEPRTLSLTALGKQRRLDSPSPMPHT